MSLSTVLAKALFDNAAESPEELAFRKGDILMVLEQEQDGGPGWWLCSLHGRQGIAPANRLRLLQTAPPPSPSPAPVLPGTDARRAPSVDSVYLSPGQQSHANGICAEDADGVYLSPPSLGEGVYQSPAGPSQLARQGELWEIEGRRPRSHSSSSPRLRPDWGDVVVDGRPRSPSLRGRVGETALVYQTPASPAPTAAQYRSQGALVSDMVYLTPSSMARPVEEPAGDVAYLTPRESGATGHSESCYLVPRPAMAALPSEDLYQTPVSGSTSVAGNCASMTVTRLQDGPVSQPKAGQEAPGMYQTPTPPGGAMSRTPQTERKIPSSSAVVLAASGQNLNIKQMPPTARTQGPSTTPPVGRGKLSQAAVRGSPLLVRAGKAGVPGSPNVGKKPPPPAPPVRSVTRKDLPQSAAMPATKPVPQASHALSQYNQEDEQRRLNKEGIKPEEKRKGTEMMKKDPNKECVISNDGNLSDQVYDTPPTNRWQHPVSAVSVEEDDSIYNTPRTIPLHTDQGSEIYNVPTLTLNPASGVAAHSVVCAEVEDEVYSVPSLPGLPLESAELPGSVMVDERTSIEGHSITSPGKTESATEDTLEVDGGIYDMPALTLDIPIRRLSVSSTGSGDVHWKTSLSSLVQSALNSTSVTTTPSRDLATSLAEILSVWKAGQVADVPPPMQQIWSRLADLLPALTVCGSTPASESLLSMVRRALEDSASLLQTQTRPRLPSQESLSRRPLPALPVAEVKPMAGGMGSRKGSWIQERPLPPPPPAAFPLPPTLATSLPPSEQTSEDEEQGNEYAGIGLTPAPPPYPAGDSVGYVKLQGKPEPSPDSQIENGTTQVISTNDARLSPSPPLQGSLSLEDSELLSFYSSQSLSHLSCLGDAIDALFKSIQENQPPRIFVSKGKCLIVTAHKLVFIGDTLARLLSSSDLRAKVTTSSGRLCQALKAVVVATKGAAQNYPSVPATQEMVDRVADLSQQAAGFSGLLQRLAEIS
ncbi:embryonal Fyn-associated substrate [Hoplias malabaricus]|uniref:embryonal Fyn-associated substrate n=1 Tax=Hoplias malabaricus TaxID=27720 RepID=UPI00346282A0